MNLIICHLIGRIGGGERERAVELNYAQGDGFKFSILHWLQFAIYPVPHMRSNFPLHFTHIFSVDRAHVRTGIPTHYSRSGHITTENARRVFGGWGCLCRAKPISANENTILSTCEPGSRRTPHNICERVRVESVDRWRTSAQRYGPCVCVCACLEQRAQL